jgi:hypothetical protein
MRVKQREMARQAEKEMHTRVNDDKQKDRAEGRKDVHLSEGEARDQLFNTTERAAARQDPNRHQLGSQLEDEDKQELQDHSKKQDKYLKNIDDALSDLKRMGEAMGTEIQYQDGVIDRVQDHTDQAHDKLRNLTGQARKDHRLGRRRT